MTFTITTVNVTLHYRGNAVSQTARNPTFSSAACSGWQKRKHQRSALLALFIKGIHRRIPLTGINDADHYIDVIMSAMASQITSLTIVYSRFIQAQIKENIKARRHWPLWGEFTGDRWFPPRKGLLTQKMFPFDDVIMHGFHVMTSSWCSCKTHCWHVNSMCSTLQ